MTIFCFVIKFNDGSSYISQASSNLNKRIESHRTIWKKKLDLEISSVQILATFVIVSQARAFVSDVIEQQIYSNLRNTVLDFNLSSEMQKQDRLEAHEKPICPEELIDILESLEIEDTEKIKFLTKKLAQLENRYIKSFFELENMQKNIKELDEIIDVAIEKSF